MRQVDIVLDDIEGILPLKDGSKAETATLRSKLGAANFALARMLRGVFPTETVRAAAVFYEVALPVIVRECAPQSCQHEAPLQTALMLNGVVTSQIALGCTGYIGFLLKKLHHSHVDERQRLARELHDRVAHEIALAVQRLEAYTSGDDDAVISQDELNLVADLLRGVMKNAGQLSGELRQTVTADGLKGSLEKYFRQHAPVGTPLHLSVTGDIFSVPNEIVQELYVIIREMIRNALLHSEPSKIWVTMNVADRVIRVSTYDDGRGFDVESVRETKRGGGLMSMQERTELLGGRFMINSLLGGGTTISLSIPLPEADDVV